jgi:hypothetical protein
MPLLNYCKDSGSKNLIENRFPKNIKRFINNNYCLVGSVYRHYQNFVLFQYDNFRGGGK